MQVSVRDRSLRNLSRRAFSGAPRWMAFMLVVAISCQSYGGEIGSTEQVMTAAEGWSGYPIANDSADLERVAFPEWTLPPGLLICSG